MPAGLTGVLMLGLLVGCGGVEASTPAGKPAEDAVASARERFLDLQDDGCAHDCGPYAESLLQGMAALRKAMNVTPAPERYNAAYVIMTRAQEQGEGSDLDTPAGQHYVFTGAQELRSWLERNP
ncbi:hypothetical protein D5S17_18085 [Pseudonocardiaceae bacterium YIM PH 21723]|nr:hypothetical protein D5S17_18085 [Pseudonocardiaceae bacterium YIM PH 21723]